VLKKELVELGEAIFKVLSNGEENDVRALLRKGGEVCSIMINTV